MRTRIAAWAVAIPVSFAIVAVPAHRAGYLSTQRLIEVVVRHNADRFVPLGVLALVWAAAMVVLLELLLGANPTWIRHRSSARRGRLRFDGRRPEEPEPSGVPGSS